MSRWTKLKEKIRRKKPEDTVKLHVPHQWSSQTTSMPVVKPSPPSVETGVKTGRRYTLIKGLAGVSILLNFVFSLLILASTPVLCPFFLVNGWLLIYTYKYVGARP